MSTRTGPFSSIRSAAVFAANDTWYTCDNITSGGNCLKILYEVGVATAGVISFIVDISEDGTNFFEVHNKKDGQKVFGTYDADVGRKIVDLSALNLSPYQIVRVSFKCSTGATSATVKIQALSYDATALADVEDITVSSITLVDRITLLDTVTNVGTLNLVNGVTLVDTVTNVGTLNLVNGVTLVGGVTLVDSVTNVGTLNLVNGVTLVDTVTNVGTLNLVNGVTLVGGVTLVDTVTNVGTLNLVNGVTLVDTVTNVGTVASVTAVNAVTSITNPVEILGYVSASSSIRVTVLNPDRDHVVSQQVCNVVNGVDGTYEYFIDMASFLEVSAQLTLSGGSGTCTVTVEATNQDDGTAPASCEYFDISSPVFGAASWTASNLILGSILCKYLRFKVVASTTGANDADWRIIVRQAA